MISAKLPVLSISQRAWVSVSDEGAAIVGSQKGLVLPDISNIWRLICM